MCCMTWIAFIFLVILIKHMIVLYVTNLCFVVEYHTFREIKDVVKMFVSCSCYSGYYGICSSIFALRVNDFSVPLKN